MYTRYSKHELMHWRPVTVAMAKKHEKYLAFLSYDKNVVIYCHQELGPNKHGLVTYIQVNVYIGNTLPWLNGG